RESNWCAVDGGNRAERGGVLFFECVDHRDCLRARGVRVDDDLRRARGVVLGEIRVGTDDRQRAYAAEIHALPLPIRDVPRHHRVSPGSHYFTVVMTRTRKPARRPNLNIISTHLEVLSL